MTYTAQETEDRFEALRGAFQVENNNELATSLGVSRQAVSAAKRIQQIPPQWFAKAGLVALALDGLSRRKVRGSGRKKLSGSDG